MEWRETDKIVHNICFHLHKIVEYANQYVVIESRSVLAWEWVKGRDVKGRGSEGCEETWADGYVHCLGVHLASKVHAYV